MSPTQSETGELAQNFVLNRLLQNRIATVRHLFEIFDFCFE